MLGAKCTQKGGGLARIAVESFTSQRRTVSILIRIVELDSASRISLGSVLVDSVRAVPVGLDVGSIRIRSFLVSTVGTTAVELDAWRVIRHSSLVVSC